MPLNDKSLLRKVILVLSLLSPFVFFSSSLIPWRSDNIVVLFSQELIYPLEYTWSSTTKFMHSIWKYYFALSDAAKENTILRSKLNQLSGRLLDYEEKQNEIIRLRSLLGFAQHYSNNHIVAEIVGSPRNAPFYTMRVNKGESDDVAIGMPVITGKGVVGRIIRTGKNFSDIHLLTDTNFYLDVLLLRTRVRGVLRGKGGWQNTLKLNRRAEIRIGDTIVTSGIVGSFPKGIPIGHVIRISYESDNISQVITVEPWVDHRRVEEVVILKNGDRELQKIMETVGKNWLKKTLNNSSGG